MSGFFHSYSRWTSRKFAQAVENILTSNAACFILGQRLPEEGILIHCQYWHGHDRYIHGYIFDYHVSAPKGYHTFSPVKGKKTNPNKNPFTDGLMVSKRKSVFPVWMLRWKNFSHVNVLARLLQVASAQYIVLEEQCVSICNDAFVILEFILLLYQNLLRKPFGNTVHTCLSLLLKN